MIGLSILVRLAPRADPDVIDALREAGGEDIPVVVRRDHPATPTSSRCKEAGVAAVYTPKDFDLVADHARHRRPRRGAQRRQPRSA